MDETTVWYYVRDGRQVGPIGTDQLKKAVTNGDLRPIDAIWHKGLPDWVAAGTIPGLFSSATVIEQRPPVNPFEPLHVPGGDPKGFEIGGERVSYAGLLRRFAAAIVDQLVLFVIGMGLGFVGGAALGMDQEPFPDARPFAIFVNLASIALAWIYFAAMESSDLQATLGKMLLRIRVCDEQGRRVSFGRATGRHFAKFLSSIPLGIGFLVALFTERKQALHDILAGCLVVNRG